MKRWSRIDWFILIIFAALVTLFYWRILTPNLADRQSFPPGDFHAQFWAFAAFEARELSTGRLPLWNPYTFAGAPFWADAQAAVFYPPSLLTFLLSAPWGFSLFALELEAIAHFWLAATFMYLFIRHVTRSRAAGFVAALIFTFSGYLTGYPSQQLAVLEADVWLPLILFQLTMNKEQLTNTSSLRFEFIPTFHLLLAGAAWGLTLLAGHPQSALIVGYISSAYFFFLWFTMPHSSLFTLHSSRFTHHFFKGITHWLIFIITGLGIAAIQFIPAVEYTLLSVRAEGTYEKMSGGFPVTDIIQVLLPGQVSFYSPLYVGIGGLILALWVSFAAPNRHTIFWGVVTFAALLISFGGNTFLYSPFYLFTPGFSIFRGQERWAFAAAFSLSVLAGYGFKQLTTFGNEQYPQGTPLSMSNEQNVSNHQSSISNLQSPISNLQPPTSNLQSPISNLQSLTKYLFFFALLLTFLFFYGLNDTGWTPDSPFYSLLGASTFLTILLALSWLMWKFSGRLHPALFTGLTAALVCLDLFSVNWQTNLYPQPPEWHTQMPKIVETLKADAAQSPDEPYRVYNEFRLYDNYGIPYEIEDLWGASPLRPNRYDEFLAPPMPIERAWELLNVKYVITWRQELFVPSTILYQEPANDGVTYLHRLETVSPRAWLVTQTQTASAPAILQTIADPNFDRRHIALLEPDSNYQLSIINYQLSITDYHVSRLTYHASRITYHVTTPAPALLILSEPYYPGWQAVVNNQPAPLLRADYILRAVPVPAGEHIVELTFCPLSFTIGAVISALTIILLGASFIISRTKRV